MSLTFISFRNQLNSMNRIFEKWYNLFEEREDDLIGFSIFSFLRIIWKLKIFRISLYCMVFFIEYYWIKRNIILKKIRKATKYCIRVRNDRRTYHQFNYITVNAELNQGNLFWSFDWWLINPNYHLCTFSISSSIAILPL